MKGRGKTGRPKSFDRDVALQRAVGHFLAYGYKGAGMRDLLASMGIARQSLYDTFVSKRDLFLEALKSYEINAMKEYNALFLAEGSPLQKIETLIQGWTEKAKQEPFQGCLINHAVVDMGNADPDIARMARDHFRKLGDLLAKCLTNAREAGEIQPETDVVALSRFLISHCQGLIVMAQTGAGPKVIDDIGRTLSALLPRP